MNENLKKAARHWDEDYWMHKRAIEILFEYAELKDKLENGYELCLKEG